MTAHYRLQQSATKGSKKVTLDSIAGNLIREKFSESWKEVVKEGCPY